MVLVSLGKLSLDLESSQSSSSSEKTMNNASVFCFSDFLNILMCQRKCFCVFVTKIFFKAAPNSCSLCIVPTFSDSLMEEISLC